MTHKLKLIQTAENYKPEVIKLVLPEPPSLNAMLDLAKKRARGRSIVYSNAKAEYGLACIAAVRKGRKKVPRDGWKRWRLDRVVFRLHSLRDTTELLAGLKWPVDFLVNYGVVEDDSPHHLMPPLPTPEQVIDRDNRCIELTISNVPEDQ